MKHRYEDEDWENLKMCLVKRIGYYVHKIEPVIVASFNIGVLGREKGTNCSIIIIYAHIWDSECAAQSHWAL